MKTMRTVFAAAALALTLTAQLHAGEPWYNDEGDCKRHWGDNFEGCRIRRDYDNQELAGIDLRISQAENARDSSVKPKQDAAEIFARIDEKHHDLVDVFLPYLTRTVSLCRELHDLLVNSAAPAVAHAKTLIEMASVAEDRPQLTAENELMLAAEKQSEAALATSLSESQTRKTQSEKTYNDALSQVQSLKSRKGALPGMIGAEIGCMGNAASYRDQKCQQFWFRRTVQDNDHGHGGGGRW